MAKLNELRYEKQEHPPYSPDMPLSGYYLFKNLKQFFSGKRFPSNVKNTSFVKQYFAENHCREGKELLEDYWNERVYWS